MPDFSSTNLKKQQQETVDFYQAFAPLKELKAELTSAPEMSSDKLFSIVNRKLSLSALLPLLKYELAQYASSSTYASPAAAILSGALSGWALINNNHYFVVLLALDAVDFASQKKLGKISHAINFQPGDMCLNILKSDGLACSRWQAPLIDDEHPATAELACAKLDEKTYRKGDKIVCAGGTEAVCYEKVLSPTLLLQTYARNNKTGVMADYDPVTHKLMRLSAADQRSTRLQVLNTVMRLMGRTDAVPTMKKLLTHKDHFVRWQTAREMIALAPDQAPDMLETLAAKDPNALVRSSARKTLNMLFS
jgi:hypothetical protein